MSNFREMTPQRLCNGSRKEFQNFKIVDSCWISSTEWPDTFRGFLYMERSKNHERKKYHNRAKNFTFLRGFDCKNTVFGISRYLIDKFVFKLPWMQENNVPIAFQR